MAVLQALGNEAETTLWVGGHGGIESALVKRANVPFTEIPAAGLHGVDIRTLPGNIWQLARGILAASRILRQFQPDVLLFTGGYVGVPMAIVGRSIPSLLFVPDIEPGLGIKLIARFADYISLTAEDSRLFFPKSNRIVVTGYPTRPELNKWTRQTARERLDLRIDRPVVLVFGGSKGARSINRALIKILPQLLEQIQIIHISGNLDWPEVQKAQAELSDSQASAYHPFPYLYQDMGAALASANLVVSRAGASTIGEFPLFGLPAILVPYPFAWRYQHINASYLEQHGTAMLLPDKHLETQLLKKIMELINCPERLQSMSHAMRALASPKAADKLADLVRELAVQDIEHGEQV